MKARILLLIIALIFMDVAQIYSFGSWTKLIQFENIAEITSLAVDSSGNVFAGTYDGKIFRSSNYGVNWTKISGIWSESYEKSVNLAVNTDGSIFTAIHGEGVYVSKDNGDNWSKVNIGNETENFYYKFAVSKQNGIYVISFQRIYLSTDNGVNWTKLYTVDEINEMYSIAVNEQGSIFIGTEYSPYYSTDNGKTWTSIKGLGCQTGLIAVNTKGSIFLHSGGNLYRSTNNGLIWVQIAINLGQINVFDMVFNKLDDIYISTNSVYFSSDNGDNWTECNKGIENYYISNLVIHRDGFIFAGSSVNGSVFRNSQPLSVKSDLVNNNSGNVEIFQNNFTNNTIIKYILLKSDYIKLSLYNSLGQKLFTLVDDFQEAGEHKVIFNSEKEPSGIYFLTIQIGDKVEKCKMILVK